MSENTIGLAASAYLYRALAEALAEPLDWFGRPGPQWPLFAAAVEAARGDSEPQISHAVIELAEIPSESLRQRRARYEAVFSGGGRPQVWLYESLAREGRLLGSCTPILWSAYAAAGLTVAGSELPDHASVELTFLSHLVEQETRSPTESAQWRKARRLFVSQHAGQWLPQLGDGLARTGDRVYAPIGRLLAAAIRREMHSRRRAFSGADRRLPTIRQAEACNLCSFCVQVCPTRALAIHETDAETVLLLSDQHCVSCARCVHVCPTRALQLESEPAKDSQFVLRQSPRARCPACGQPTVSQAELEAVSTHIGAPVWLDYCLECRSLLLEDGS